ncbi:unnamed protein product, partial [Symbiodinium sp. CCMP2456]
PLPVGSTQGGWQRTQAGPYAPNSVADASQRLPGPGPGYMISVQTSGPGPAENVNYGIPSRPATFAGMALEDLSGYPQGHPGAQGQVHAMPMHQAPQAPYQMGPPHAMGPAHHPGPHHYMQGCHQGPCGPGPGPCIQMHPGMGPQVSFQASSGRAPARPVHYGPASGGDQQEMAMGNFGSQCGPHGGQGHGAPSGPGARDPSGRGRGPPNSRESDDFREWSPGQDDFFAHLMR